jgi:hypothetical protein
LLVEAIYLDYNTLEAAIKQLAKANGYAISRDGKTATKVTWICTKGGKYNNKNKTKAGTLMPKDFKGQKNT